MDRIIDGIKVTVRKKRIKNMYLYVKPPDGHVEISAPYGLSEERIAEFVRKRRDWIIKNQERIISGGSAAEPDLLDGETHMLWGEPFTLKTEQGKKNGVRIDGGRIVMTLRDPEHTDRTARLKVMNEWYRAQLKERIGERLPVIESATGLKCSGWQVKNMRSRWGTCNTATDRIWLNLQLAKKPIVCLDYVILHELAHTRVKNHGSDFKAIMDKYMPKWRDVRKQLNRMA